jgi:hypothetical protein
VKLNRLNLGLCLAPLGVVLAGPIQFGPPMSEPSPFLLWDLSTTVRPSFGYKDNPTLAPDAFKSGSAFLGLGVELLLFRLPTGDDSFHLFWAGDDRRYLNSDLVDTEQLFVTQASYRRTLGENWSAGLSAQHVFVNQVIDLSSEDLGIGIGRAAGHTLTLRPSVRLDVGTHWYVEAETEGTRQLYDAPLDDYWEYVPKLLVGFRFAYDSSVTAAYTHTWRPFDDSQLLTPSRELLPGTDTRIQSDRFELRWRQNWNAAKSWSTTVRAFHVLTRDNGLGFFDYHRTGVSGTVQWAPGRWTLKATARASRYDYDEQLIAPDEDTTRVRKDLAVETRVEFALRKTLLLFASYELDHSQGNVSQDNFTANTFQGGLEWEF